jgi:hypothetical protein
MQPIYFLIFDTQPVLNEYFAGKSLHHPVFKDFNRMGGGGTPGKTEASNLQPHSTA